MTRGLIVLGGGEGKDNVGGGRVNAGGGGWRGLIVVGGCVGRVHVGGVVHNGGWRCREGSCGRCGS